VSAVRAPVKIGGDRRDQILEVAAGLIAAQGSSATTVRQIADGVGILSGSLYHHFKAKDAILEAIIIAHLEDLLERYGRVAATQATPVEQIKGLIYASFDALAAGPHASEIYQNEYRYMASQPGFAPIRDATHRVQHCWLGVIHKGVDEGVFRADIEPLLFYRFTRDAIWPTVRWYRHEGSPPLSEIADACVRLFLNGFST
jgi:AcrR family transcriptional regulator